MNMDDLLKDIGKKNTPKKEKKAVQRIQLIYYKDLKPSPKNFYETKDIEKLASAIRIAGKVNNALHVRKLGKLNEYEVNEGHRRRLAIIYLVEQMGLKEFEFVPCIVEDTTDVVGELNLILSNSTQREYTEHEKMKEVERLRVLLEQYAEENKTKISSTDMRKIIANILGVSGTKVAQLQSIDRNLIPEAKQKFEKGEIPVSVANEMAGLPEEAQKRLTDREDIKLPDVKKMKEDSKKQIKKVAKCSYDQKYVCNIDEIIEKYKPNRNIAECPGCCNICGYTDECMHVCERVLDDKKLSEEEMKKVAFTFQDVKMVLGYVKRQIPNTKIKDEDAVIRLKVITEALQKYMKDMTERVEVDYDGK